MEHHFWYLSTSGRFTEACGDSDQMSIAIRLFDVLGWYSSDRQTEDSASTRGERNVIGMILIPNPSLQCGNADIQNFMF